MSELIFEDDEKCTCDITGEDECPVHYLIDDGTEEEEEGLP